MCCVYWLTWSLVSSRVPWKRAFWYSNHRLSTPHPIDQRLPRHLSSAATDGDYCLCCLRAAGPNAEPVLSLLPSFLSWMLITFFSIVKHLFADCWSWFQQSRLIVSLSVVLPVRLALTDRLARSAHWHELSTLSLFSPLSVPFLSSFLFFFLLPILFFWTLFVLSGLSVNLATLYSFGEQNKKRYIKRYIPSIFVLLVRCVHTLEPSHGSMTPPKKKELNNKRLWAF